MVTIGSLFTGAAALCELAVAPLLGGRVVWHCEVDPAASRLLTYRRPDVPNLGDITAVDWSAVEPVDVLAYGFPCQDISSAGRQAGIEGARSGLWTYSVEAIRVLRPRLVVVENVAALVVRGLDRVLADLAALGFDAEWSVVRASDVGAPHRRERLILVASGAAGPRRGPLQPVDVGEHGGQADGLGPAELGRRGGLAADPDSNAVRQQPVRLGRSIGAAVARLARSRPAGGLGEVRLGDRAVGGRPRPAGAAPDDHGRTGREEAQPGAGRVDDGLAGRMGDRRSRAVPERAAAAVRQRCGAAADPGRRAPPAAVALRGRESGMTSRAARILDDPAVKGLMLKQGMTS